MTSQVLALLLAEECFYECVCVQVHAAVHLNEPVDYSGAAQNTGVGQCVCLTQSSYSPFNELL